MDPRHILVVDDEPPIVDLLGDLLRRAGYAVDAAGTAAEALQRIRDRLYDAAILDFNLPDMNGVMLHREMRQIDPDLARRTLFVSGYVQSGETLDYYANAGCGFVAKPFDAAEILAAVAALLDG